MSVLEEHLDSALIAGGEGGGHSFATSIQFHFEGSEGDRPFEIKQMGRNHGYSCPKERYGQNKHEIINIA
jgi:hypothetical protein